MRHAVKRCTCTCVNLRWIFTFSRFLLLHLQIVVQHTLCISSSMQWQAMRHAMAGDGWKRRPECAQVDGPRADRGRLAGSGSVCNGSPNHCACCYCRSSACSIRGQLSPFGLSTGRWRQQMKSVYSTLADSDEGDWSWTGGGSPPLRSAPLRGDWLMAFQVLVIGSKRTGSFTAPCRKMLGNHRAVAPTPPTPCGADAWLH